MSSSSSTSRFIWDWGISTVVAVLIVQLPSFFYSHGCTDSNCWPFVGVLSLYACLTPFVYPALSVFWSKTLTSGRTRVARKLRQKVAELLDTGFVECSSIAFSYAMYYLVTQVETDISNYFHIGSINNQTIKYEENFPHPRPPPHNGSGGGNDHHHHPFPQPNHGPLHPYDRPPRQPRSVIDPHSVPRDESILAIIDVVTVDLLIALVTTFIVVIIVKYAKQQSRNFGEEPAPRPQPQRTGEIPEISHSPLHDDGTESIAASAISANISVYWEYFFYLLQESFHVTLGYVWDHFFSELFFRKLESDNGSAATLITFLRFVRTAIWFAVFPSVGLRLMRQVNEVGGYDQSWAECTREVLAKAVIAMLAYSITLSVYGLCMYYLAARTSNGVGLGCLYGYAVVVTVWGAVVTQSTWWHAKCKAHADKGDTAFQTFWELQIGWLVSYAVWYPLGYSLELLPASGNELWMSIGIVLVVALSIGFTALWLAARHIKSEYVSGRLSMSDIHRLSISSFGISLLGDGLSSLAPLTAHAAPSVLSSYGSAVVGVDAESTNSNSA